MDDMFQEFYAQETTVGYSASNILASFWLSKRKAYEELASNKEQDAHEFFQFLTEELHEINGGGRPTLLEDSPVTKRNKTGNEPNCKCIVHQTFYGKLQSTITCQSCGDDNASIESFLDLSLGLDVLAKKKGLKVTTQSALSLQKCLDEEYIRPERCEYTCNQCGTQEARKQLSIKSLPNVLCIQLKVSTHPHFSCVPRIVYLFDEKYAAESNRSCQVMAHLIAWGIESPWHIEQDVVWTEFRWLRFYPTCVLVSSSDSFAFLSLYNPFDWVVLHPIGRPYFRNSF